MSRRSVSMVGLLALAALILCIAVYVALLAHHEEEGLAPVPARGPIDAARAAPLPPPADPRADAGQRRVALPPASADAAPFARPTPDAAAPSGIDAAAIYRSHLDEPPPDIERKVGRPTIEAALKQLEPLVRSCYRQALKSERPGLAGKVSLAFDVVVESGEATLRNSAITTSELRSPPTEACMREAAGRVRFPVPGADDGTVRVHYPFNFEAVR